MWMAGALVLLSLGIEPTSGERWKAFREHLEKAGRKDLLPEETAAGKAPSADAIVGALFRMSADLAAAHDMIESEPADVSGARKRLAKLDGTADPYLADYATLFKARCDLVEKKYPEAVRGFESVLRSSRNLAAPAARKGLAESYRGQSETTLEILELRFLLADLPPSAAADRSWAEERLSEIRREHPGPLEDSAKRMREISKRLAGSGSSEGGTGEQKKVEEILEKVAKLLEEEAKRSRILAESLGKARARGQRGQAGSPDGRGEPAKRSGAGRTKAREKDLRDRPDRDSDAWGSINDREVAKALQDLWGKIPPGYRQVVTQYFKDIAGLDAGSAPEDQSPATPRRP